MKLYIWEGDGISDAYHDDGTLVVLAKSPSQAREVIRAGLESRAAKSSWGDGKGSDYFDGSDHALDREPDRVIELDEPAWVAFNGGGYD